MNFRVKKFNEKKTVKKETLVFELNNFMNTWNKGL
jgi:hypothetical protein